MACCKVLLSIIAAICGIILWFALFSNYPDIPKLEDVYWAKPTKQMNKEVFKIEVPEHVILSLKSELRKTVFTKPLEGVGFEYGINTDYLKYVIDYWTDKYDWSTRQAILNSVPQFKHTVSGLNIHYIHIKPNEKDSRGKTILPLLLLHGWPGSVKEFYKTFPLLTKSRKDFDFIFEIIVPSLPGYGFSDAATKPGLGAAQVALIMKKLMNDLGFEKFYVQGGDWGAVIASNIATMYPSNVLGLHSTMCGSTSLLTMIKLLLGSLWPSLIVDEKYIHRVYPLLDKYQHMLQESGYFHLQATKPDTVGIALQNCPAGLAGYILEKYSSWTNFSWRSLPDGGLNNYDLDDLLDNVMIYWITGTITTSVRLYSETFTKKQFALKLDSVPTNVPTVCSFYPTELFYTPEIILREKYKNLVRTSHPPKGGHFAAFEQPEIFADDVWNAVNDIKNFWRKNQKEEL